MTIGVDRPPRPRDEEGFSLVETIVAFAMLSLVMTAAVQIVGNGSTRMRAGEDRSVALAHARSQLAVLAASRTILENSAGTFDDGFSWRLHAAPFPGGASSGSALALYAVRITVQSSTAEQPQVNLKTVLLGRAPETR